MKRMTLFLAVTGFAVAASAQQNDFFDIQKHLQKKRNENKPVTSPLLVKPSFRNQFTGFPSGKSTIPKKLSHILANGDKIYLLLQDNMPCIIPDMGQFSRPYITGLIKGPAFSPTGITIGKIPNAAMLHQTEISK